MNDAIGVDDSISRCIIYDRFFDGNTHIDDLLFQFGQSEEDGASHESAVLRSLALNDADVHAVGCKIAQSQNARKNNPLPGKGRRYYCGFRTARVGDMPLCGPGYCVKLTNDGDEGEKSHVDVALYIEAKEKSRRNTLKTNAGMALAEAFGPPTPHICNCDEGDEEHPLNKYGINCLINGLLHRWPDVLVPNSPGIGPP